MALTYPDGKTVHYAYDLASRLVRVTDWLSHTDGYVYDAAGEPITTTLANGVTTAYGYDSAHRLTSIAHSTLSGTVASYTYVVDAAGNRSGVTESILQPGGTVTTTVISYTYDSLYRLANARYSSGQVFTYTYDAVGNRLTQTTLTNTTVYTYDIANRLTNVGTQAYSWDNNGNLLNNGVLTYTYSSANMPITITQGANMYVFGYDGMGDRRRQIVNGTPTTYTLDLNAGLVQVLADGSGNTYVYGNGRIAQQSATAAGYFLGDALGSVRQLADANGNVTLAKRYDPYGNVITSTGAATSIYGFDAEQMDGTSLIFLRARYYASYLGQFIQPDPIVPDFGNPQTLDRYVYVEDNSINRVDPTGMFSCAEYPDFSNSRCAQWLNSALENMKTHGSVGALLVQKFRERDAELEQFQTSCAPRFTAGLLIAFIPGGVGGITPPLSLPVHIVLDTSYLDRPADDSSAVSIFAHEMTHLLLEDQETRGTIVGEVYAFQAQARVTEELGGNVARASMLGQLEGIDLHSRSQLTQARDVLLNANMGKVDPFLPPLEYMYQVTRNDTERNTLIRFTVYRLDKLAPAGWTLNP